MGPQEGNGKPKEVVDNRQKLLDAAMKRNQHQPDALIEVLHTAQELYGFLQDDILLYITKKLKLPPSKVFGVATFYNFFSLAPKGEHSCIVCMGTACYVKGAGEILDKIEKKLNIENGSITSDGMFSLDSTRCIGACGLAPIVTVNDDVYDLVTPSNVDAILDKYIAISKGPKFSKGKKK